MRRALMVAVAVFATSVSISSVQAADNWHDFWQRFHLDFHRNNCWPEPFIHADRAAARAPFQIMAHNGWRQQNTLSDSLFHHETNQLTHAGVLRIRWIVTQHPPKRRMVYVLAGSTKDSTDTRVDAVQRTIAQVLPSGELPPVILTSKVPLSGSGDYFDQVDRQVRTSIPSPRLPAAGGGDGG